MEGKKTPLWKNIASKTWKVVKIITIPWWGPFLLLWFINAWATGNRQTW